MPEIQVKETTCTSDLGDKEITRQSDVGLPIPRSSESSVTQQGASNSSTQCQV